jgi:hypothetical protein
MDEFEAARQQREERRRQRAAELEDLERGSAVRSTRSRSRSQSRSDSGSESDSDSQSSSGDDESGSSGSYSGSSSDSDDGRSSGSDSERSGEDAESSDTTDEDEPIADRLAREKQARRTAQKRFSALIKQIGAYKKVVEDEKAELEDELDRARKGAASFKQSAQSMLAERDRELSELVASRQAMKKENMESLSVLLKEMALIEETSNDVEQQLEEEKAAREADQKAFLEAGELVEGLQEKVDVLKSENKELKRSLASKERDILRDSAVGQADAETESLVDEVLRLRKEVAVERKRIEDADAFLLRARGALGVSEDAAATKAGVEAAEKLKSVESELEKLKAERASDRKKMSSMKRRIMNLNSTLSRVTSGGSVAGEGSGEGSPATPRSSRAHTKDKRRHRKPATIGKAASTTALLHMAEREKEKGDKPDKLEKSESVSDVTGFRQNKIIVDPVLGLVPVPIDAAPAEGQTELSTPKEPEPATNGGADAKVLFARVRAAPVSDSGESAEPSPWVKVSVPSGGDPVRQALWSSVAGALDVPRAHIEIVALGDGPENSQGIEEAESSAHAQAPTTFSTELDAEAAAELEAGDYLEVVVNSEFDADAEFGFEAPAAQPPPKPVVPSLADAAAMFGSDGDSEAMKDILAKLEMRESGGTSAAAAKRAPHLATKKNKRSSMMLFRSSSSNLVEGIEPATSPKGTPSRRRRKDSKKGDLPPRRKKEKKSKSSKREKKQRKGKSSAAVPEVELSGPNEDSFQQNRMMLDTKTGNLVVVRPGEDPPPGAVSIDSASVAASLAPANAGSRGTISLGKGAALAAALKDGT